MILSRQAMLTAMLAFSASGFFVSPIASATPDAFPLTDAVDSLYAHLGLPAPERSALERQETESERFAPGLPQAAARILLTGLDASSSSGDLMDAAYAVTTIVPRKSAGEAQDVLFLDTFHLVVIGAPEVDSVYDGNIVPVGNAYLPSRWQALTIDLGGNDLYRNTAGGAVAEPQASSGDLKGAVFSVSIDLSDGARHDDVYDCTSWGCNLPVQGSARGSATGILIDAAGADTYIAATPDTCYGQWCYRLGPLEVMGQAAAESGGHGYLVDRGGDDEYRVDRGLAFVRTGGRATFLDTAGSDSHDVVQGLATALGTTTAGGDASFSDLGGADDRYRMVAYNNCRYAGCLEQSAAGVALTLDESCDAPLAPSAPCPGLSARFLDDAGDDFYDFDRDLWAYGVGTPHTIASFFDLGGSDYYGGTSDANNDHQWFGSTQTVGTVTIEGQTLPTGHPGGFGLDVDHLLDRSAPLHRIVNRAIDQEEQTIHYCIFLQIVGNDIVADAATDALGGLDDEPQPAECQGGSS